MGAAGFAFPKFQVSFGHQFSSVQRSEDVTVFSRHHSLSP